ncbi:uncharacterized protein LOC18435609 isoform X2 [Amborella trichopoda]|uniref:uncharacterized protein LOC18435609 isoform X2 n=1 Tax=Amborella trichopoda TaxID=13333 RepID=UPI0009C10959|nr:uncharacterized protein LOC18435609 isoform X2 [Amborella trichopoda]|eukprot:XP_020523532.1 uncharacterized protein LOC18435609 isoform X2 [Amborella trichopoda]
MEKSFSLYNNKEFAFPGFCSPRVLSFSKTESSFNVYCRFLSPFGSFSLKKYKLRLSMAAIEEFKFSPSELQKRLNQLSFIFQSKQSLSLSRFNLVSDNGKTFFSRWFSCFVSSWRGPIRVFMVLLLWLCLIGESKGEEAQNLQRYACEDVLHYYAPVQDLKGAPLMEKLHSIVSGHQALRYKEVWDAREILDAADVDNPETSSEVIEIYTLRAVPKSLAGKPDGWNREHLWPRSYGLKDGLSVTDLHNLRPADVNVNSSRGNKYYGECAPKESYCIRPANKEAAPDTATDKERWAPPLLVRGDIARSLMYMAIRYGLHQPSGAPDLQLSDTPSMENGRMGLLAALLPWNEIDPPSISEQLRNDRICGHYQHNRNPFVDHPEYANLIWKIPNQPNSVGYDTFQDAWINEFHYNNKGKDRNEFVEVVVRESMDPSDFTVVLYNGSNGRTYMSLPLTNGRIFTKTSGGSGFLIYTAFVPLQNGPSDGIALASSKHGNTNFKVIQFLSYGGVVKAIDGPAIGSESIDIKLKETAMSSEYDSLGLEGDGTEEFRWKRFMGEATPGKLNQGQMIIKGP